MGTELILTISKVFPPLKFLVEKYENVFAGKLLKVFEKDGNVFGVYRNGSERQLTSKNADTDPLLIRKKGTVIFLRKVHEGGKQAVRIMTLKVATLQEDTLLDQKPYWDGLLGDFPLYQVEGFTLSPDQTKVVFLIEKWVTSSVLVLVDIKTGELKELFPASKFEFIRSGNYKGKFLVDSYEIENDKGRQLWHKVRDWDGTTLKRFESYDEYRTFRSSAMQIK
ncbi:hypothetical protein AB9P05_19225 [Roseivirga sp. BDSF3-8]|uniref:hypothetical protein n=1 Tax=Roseivirga sp. BDSF3-8 TaxID=3241598 RepID=UPI003531D4DF